MFRTACLVAALALCAATAPPRISLELAATHTAFSKGTSHTVDEDYAQECEANKAGHPAVESCKFPIAKAYDAQDQDLSPSVNVAIRLLDNDEVEVDESVKGSPFNNADAPVDASQLQNPRNNRPAAETPSTYLFEYDVRDSAGNDAEKVTFALVLNDVTPPAIVWDSAMRPAPTSTGQPAAHVTVEYGSGLFLSGLKHVKCDDNVYSDVKPTISVGNLPPSTSNAKCMANMNTEVALDRCSAFSANFIDLSTKESTVKVVCEDHASIYGENGQDNVNTFDMTISYADTTAPVIDFTNAEETHECDRDAAEQDVQAWETTVCYDDKLPVMWHHDHSRMTVTPSKTCPINVFNAQALHIVPHGDSQKGNTADASTYDNTCDIEYSCKDESNNEAVKRTRKYYVVDTTPPTMDIDYSNGVAGSGQQKVEATADRDSLKHLIHPRDNTVIMGHCTENKNLVPNGDCAAALDGTLAHWHCSSDGKKCNFEDDMDGKFDINNGAIYKAMQFTDTCTEAQHLRFTANWVVEDGFGTWDDGRAVGTYKRKYTVSDESGNHVAADVLIYLQDPDAPYIQMLGCANTSATGSCVDAVEYSQPGEVYRDFGATCHDYVDGNLSHAVEVSGEVVDMKKPKTYLINYNCQDLSGNAATTLTRTVIVRDTAAPVIILNGEAENFVEAGFPYSDAGACYSDMLDGQCCLNIADDAHTPQPGANINGVGCPANTMMTGIWKTVTVNGQDSTLAGNAFATSLADDHTSGIVQTHRDMRTPNTNSNRAIGGDHGAELTYVITYNAKDFNGNQATPVTRKIFVRDTLPPVITLHPYNGGVLVKQNLYNVSRDAKYRAAGYRNPASHKIGELPTVSAANLGTDHPDNTPTNNRFNWANQGNPHMMAETSSVNGWLFAAVASAVAGVALLSFSTKSSNQVMVPV